MEGDSRLPTHIFIEAQLQPLNGRGIYYYIRQRGEKNSGLILLKLNNLEGQCHLLSQQRNLDDEMGWIHVLNKEEVEEAEADAYISRAIMRDPDLWVIEIEDRAMQNPFDGKIISF